MIEENINERLRIIESLMLAQKNVLTFDEVAVYTGISKSYLYKLTSGGGIPCYKPNGKLIYFSKLELDSWLLQNRKATNKEIENKAITIVTLKNGGAL